MLVFKKMMNGDSLGFINMWFLKQMMRLLSRDRKKKNLREMIVMAILNLTPDNFKEKTREGLVLVDFYAEWCGPCKMLNPVLEELANETENLDVCKVNVDEAKELAIEFGVSTIPTILFFKNGEVVFQEAGYKPKEVLVSLIGSFD